MSFNKLSGISDQPAKADKSAMGTVNRPLRSLPGYFVNVHNYPVVKNKDALKHAARATPVNPYCVF